MKKLIYTGTINAVVTSTGCRKIEVDGGSGQQQRRRQMAQQKIPFLKDGLQPTVH